MSATSKNIQAMTANLKSLAKELEKAQEEMAQGPVSQSRGEEIERKAKEMEELQKHVDSYNRIAGVTKRAREVMDPTLPGEHERGGSSRGRGQKRLITTPGHMFVASDAFQKYRGQGKEGWSAKVDVRALRGKHVQLVGDDAVEFEKKAYDPAVLSDMGTDAIIEYDRDRELVRYEEPEILTIRDVLNVAPTTADSIRFVRHVATERAAASQNPRRGGLKGYLRVEFEPETVATETIAVLSKVTEQDVDDAPRLISQINGEMQLDVRVEEERQLLHGLGSNGEILGLYNQGIPEYNRTAVGTQDETLIDVIRRMRTDLRKRRVQPNFVCIDPLDWEQIELEKGSDLRYIFGLVDTLRGPRVWSLNVVESDAMTDPATNERRVLMGDGIRGATLYDRHQVRLAIGYVDDDFARNLRTLRAEQRIALAVKRSFAFSWYTTAEASS